MKLIHFPDAPDQKWGVQNDLLDKGFKTVPDKKNIFFHFYAQILATHFDRFFEVLNFAHFQQRFTTLKQSLQKKSQIPWRSPRKGWFSILLNENFENPEINQSGLQVSRH